MKGFFKIRRKLKLIYRKFLLRWNLSALKSLHAPRFNVGSNFQADRFWDIHFDLSASSVRIGNDFLARQHFCIRAENNGQLSIGDNVFFNNFCSITCMGKITIGNHCLFGENVRLYDHNHRFDQPGVPIQEQGFSVGEIRIGNNCWIGSNVVLLKNVTIGDNVVIGAGCIVHKSIPANTIYIQSSEAILKHLL